MGAKPGRTFGEEKRKGPGKPGDPRFHANGVPIGRTWKKGCPSPNPGGRPKDFPELKALARTHTVDAIATLATIMKDESQPGPARILAANSLLDRGYGKPQLHMQSEITINHEIDGMTAQQLRDFIAREGVRLGVFTIELEAEEVEEAPAGIQALPSPE